MSITAPAFGPLDCIPASSEKFAILSKWGCIFICQFGAFVALVGCCWLNSWGCIVCVAWSPGCRLGPLGGFIGASVWVVGGGCIWGGCCFGGHLAALLLQRRTVGLRLGWGPTSCLQGATILPFPTISSSSLLMKIICNLFNHQFINTTIHKAHLCRINMSRGAFIFSRDQLHPAQQMIRQQEHLLCLQEHFYLQEHLLEH